MRTPRESERLPNPASRIGALALASALSTALLLTAAAEGLGQQPAKSKGQTPPPTLPPDFNKQFVDPNVPDFVKRFESDSREVYAKRKAIVAAIKLKPGMYVADVGAGTGVFTRLFAEKVGPNGRVYAQDVADPFLKHIAAESKKLGQDQVVRTIKGSQLSTFLPRNVMDVVFLCDVYHHVENPPAVLDSIHNALKPDGRLVLVDFDKEKAKDVDFVQKHVRAEKSVYLQELKAAGFEPIDAPDAPDLKENFFLVFRWVKLPPKIVD
jgi:ubiquinone/menaquinone biosynthesis C-methylase UbiE